MFNKWRFWRRRQSINPSSYGSSAHSWSRLAPLTFHKKTFALNMRHTILALLLTALGQAAYGQYSPFWLLTTDNGSRVDSIIVQGADIYTEPHTGAVFIGFKALGSESRCPGYEGRTFGFVPQADFIPSYNQGDEFYMGRCDVGESFELIYTWGVDGDPIRFDLYWDSPNKGTTITVLRL